MKTAEQNKQEVINYLRLTAQHRFLKGESETFSIVETENGEFYEFKNGKPATQPINIDWYVKEYMSNAKNVISHGRLFYRDHGYKSIKRKYYDKLISSM